MTDALNRARFVRSSTAFLIQRMETMQQDIAALEHAITELPGFEAWERAIKEHCPEANVARIAKRATTIEKEMNP